MIARLPQSLRRGVSRGVLGCGLGCAGGVGWGCGLGMCWWCGLGMWAGDVLVVWAGEAEALSVAAFWAGAAHPRRQKHREMPPPGASAPAFAATVEPASYPPPCKTSKARRVFNA